MNKDSGAEMIIPAGVAHPLPLVYGYSTALALWVAGAAGCWLWYWSEAEPGRLVLAVALAPALWFFSLFSVVQVSLWLALVPVRLLGLDMEAFDRIACGLVLMTFSGAALWLMRTCGGPGRILGWLWWAGLAGALILSVAGSRQKAAARSSPPGFATSMQGHGDRHGS